MEPGFRNFDPVRRAQILATDRDGEITAPESGLIMMPLYQKQGNDGFFIVRPVARFWLWLSALLRNLSIRGPGPFTSGCKGLSETPGAAADRYQHCTVLSAADLSPSGLSKTAVEEELPACGSATA